MLRPRCAAGYAQMASLVVAWTNDLQEEDGVTDQPVKLDEAHFLRVRQRRGPWQPTLVLPGMLGCHEHDKQRLGLQELAKQHFDPDKFSGIFTGGGGGPPRWLDGPGGLIADR